MSDDYEIDDLACPQCGHETTHSRLCCECDDGRIDEHEDDPINFPPGDECRQCPACLGHGVERWCPECGANYWRGKRPTVRGLMQALNLEDDDEERGGL